MTDRVCRGCGGGGGLVAIDQVFRPPPRHSFYTILLYRAGDQRFPVS